VPGHVGVAVLQGQGDKTDVTIYVGHGLAPISASGAAHDHATPTAMQPVNGMGDMPGMNTTGEAAPAPQS
jgi:hypothetical protein